jgi:hypothetical protein
MTADPTNKRRPADAWPAKHACIDRKLSMRAQKMAELPRQETLDAPRPRWGEETLDRIAAVYEAERGKATLMRRGRTCPLRRAWS